jgi:trimeric autotransporter adhesin
VALSSADPNVVKIQQSSVNVPAGSNTAEFTVTTEPVSSPTPVTITASSQNVQKTTTLTVQPPPLIKLTLNPTSLLGGATSQGTVQLGGPAPAGFTVDLRSTNTALATVQQSITVPANSTSTTFTVNARPVASTSTVNIVASRSGVDQAAPLSVQSPVLSGFTFSPQRIGGGQSSTGTISLNGRAPGGTSVALSPSNATTANIPQTVPVPPDATQASFTATGRTFTGADRSVTVTASYLGGSRSANLTVAGVKSKDKDKDKEEVDFASFEMLTAEGPRSTGGPFATDEESTGDDTEEAPASGRPFIQREELPRVSGPRAKPINEQPK